MFQNVQLPPKANGKARGKRAYYAQGWEAVRAGYALEECPYPPFSKGEKHWKRGHNSE